VPDIWKDLGAFIFKSQAVQDNLAFEVEDTTFLKNVGYHSPHNTALHPRRCQTSEQEDMFTVVQQESFCSCWYVTLYASCLGWCAVKVQLIGA